MHEIKREMKADQEQPEMQLSQWLVVHSPGHLREPVIESREEAEQNSADYYDIVALGMAEAPKEMIQDPGGAARLSMEEMPAQAAVNGQHDLRSRERTYSQNHQSCHDEIEPNEKRHFPQLHAGTPQTED